MKGHSTPKGGGHEPQLRTTDLRNHPGHLSGQGYIDLKWPQVHRRRENNVSKENSGCHKNLEKITRGQELGSVSPFGGRG